MNENKHYYWFKLKDDFFAQLYIKKLRKIAGGDTYVIIYQKILLLTVKTNGYLTFQGIEKTFSEELALILDEDKDNVAVTLEFMKAHKLIEQSENDNEYILPDILFLIGSENESAERVRAYRERKKQEFLSLSQNKKALQCNGDVTQCNENVTTDIDKDKDIDIDKEKEYKEKESSHPPFPPKGESLLNEKTVLEVLDYLNLKTGKSFSVKNGNNLKNIRTRLKEGFTVEQLKAVIDKKTVEWLNDEKMNQYLNPETLFRPKKFEIYLNSKPPGMQAQENKYANVKTTHIDNVTGKMWVTGG